MNYVPSNMPDPGVSRAQFVTTPFGDVLTPDILCAALEGGAKVGHVAQLWEQAWPQDFPGPVLAIMALCVVLDARAESSLN